MEECTVCCNPFNRLTHKRGVCPYCPACICIACHKKYVMNTTEGIHCMGCRTAWPLDVSYTLFPTSFWKAYEDHRAELCMAQEKNFLPETMIQLKRERLKQELKGIAQGVLLLSNRVKTRTDALVPQTAQPGVNTSSLFERIAEYAQTYANTKTEFDRLCCPGYVDGASVEVEPVAADPADPHPDIYLPCPAGACKGFTNRRGTCDMCNAKVCLKCRMPKGDEHTCNPGDVATVELVKKDCKPCPRCRVLIQRIEGCPQMFCTACHCKFHWHTGEILKKIHNPHLTEWRLAHGKDTEDTEDTAQTPCDLVVAYSAFPPDAHFKVRAYYDHAMHLTRHVIPALLQRVEPVHVSLRRKFLLDEIDETAWKNELRLHNRKVERTQEIIQILEMFHGVVFRVLDEVNRKSTTWDAVEPLLKEVTDAMNRKLEEIGRRYKIVVYKYQWVVRKDPYEFML